MAEIAFARSFFTALDGRPVKLSADHVEDPKRYPARAPFILPRMPRPMSRPTTTAPGQERSITVSLRSVRNPRLDLKLTSQPPVTSVLDIKNIVAKHVGVPVASIRLLHRKKPAPDSKTLGELVADRDASCPEVEFSVMVIGGAAAIPPPGPASETAAAAAAAAQERDGSSAAGAAALATPAFWQDLKGFLMLRLKEETVAEETFAIFQQAWAAKK